ncbi:hypothetical protein ABK040_002822 [Willaertia magna]
MIHFRKRPSGLHNIAKTENDINTNEYLNKQKKGLFIHSSFELIFTSDKLKDFLISFVTPSINNSKNNINIEPILSHLDMINCEFLDSSINCKDIFNNYYILFIGKSVKFLDKELILKLQSLIKLKKITTIFFYPCELALQLNYLKKFNETAVNTHLSLQLNTKLLTNLTIGKNILHEFYLKYYKNNFEMYNNELAVKYCNFYGKEDIFEFKDKLFAQIVNQYYIQSYYSEVYLSPTSSCDVKVREIITFVFSAPSSKITRIIPHDLPGITNIKSYKVTTLIRFPATGTVPTAITFEFEFSSVSGPFSMESTQGLLQWDLRFQCPIHNITTKYFYNEFDVNNLELSFFSPVKTTNYNYNNENKKTGLVSYTFKVDYIPVNTKFRPQLKFTSTKSSLHCSYAYDPNITDILLNEEAKIVMILLSILFFASLVFLAFSLLYFIKLRRRNSVVAINNANNATTNNTNDDSGA